MITVLCALYQEAAPLIRALCLSRDPDRTPFQHFCGEGISLYLTGPGEIAAAACTGFALGRVPASSHLVNFGSAAGPWKEAGTLFLADALTEEAAGRCHYPDLLLRSDLPECAVRTVPGPAQQEAIALANEEAERPVLFDMEAAAIWEAAMPFCGPDRVHILKFVSDTGKEERITPERLSALSEEVLPEVLAYLSLLRRAEKEEALVAVPDGEALERAASLFCCSVSMRERLRVLLRWCALSGRDFDKEVRTRLSRGELPAPNKREGKKVLDAIEHALTTGG